MVTVLELGRHGWGDIHNVAGIVFLGIVALHLVLHWRWIRCLPRLLATRPDSHALERCGTSQSAQAQQCEPDRKATAVR